MAIAKRLRKAAEGIDRTKNYPLTEAVKMIRDRATAKFDETIEVALNLGVDPRHADQMVRGVVTLPNGTGKTVRVAVFAKGEKAELAKAAGADIVGADDLAAEVQAGNINFDRCIATPDMMVVVGKLGKVLGPRGLMPNPKLGTVTPNVAEAVKNAKAGMAKFRTDKAGIVHCSVGSANFDKDKLQDNLLAVVRDIRKQKPSSSKGVYIKKVTLSTTMGPGIRVDVSSLPE